MRKLARLIPLLILFAVIRKASRHAAQRCHQQRSPDAVTL